MAKLTTKKRNALPDSAFAGPNRSYPVQDKAHAANAKARATQQVKKGNLSPSTAATIKAKANKRLGGAAADGSKGAPHDGAKPSRDGYLHHNKTVGKVPAGTMGHHNITNPQTHAHKLKHE